MNFLKVWTELDNGKFKSLPAKMISKNSKGVFTIKYLSPINKRTISGKKIYTYEDETYEITEESIVQQVESELTLGFEELANASGNFVKFDLRDIGGDDQEEDEDYVPGASSENGSDDDEDSSDWSSDDDDDASNGDEDEEDQESEEEEEFYEDEE
jgi:hypothetical protein